MILDTKPFVQTVGQGGFILNQAIELTVGAKIRKIKSLNANEFAPTKTSLFLSRLIFWFNRRF
jgi:hypothetical protein